VLHTNVVSDLVRTPQGVIAQRISVVGEARVCTSVIVAAELRYGASKNGSARLIAQVGVVLGAFEVLPFDAPADAVYARVRTDLERQGQLKGLTGVTSR
jgi:tRNA(fMet)-specific endonuclease VapC